MADIGKRIKRITIEPQEIPAPAPVETPVPARPDLVPA